MMRHSSLSEGLYCLREKIVDGRPMEEVLLQVDRLISADKYRSSQSLIQTKDKTHKYEKRAKEAEKQLQSMKEQMENMRRDLDMKTVKIENLLKQLNKEDRAQARRQRQQAKLLKPKKEEFQVQVETLTAHLYQGLIKEFTSERQANQRLRSQIQQLDDMSKRKPSTSSTEGNDDEVEEGASFCEYAQQLSVSELQAEASEGQSRFDWMRTMSKSIIDYFKDQ